MIYRLAAATPVFGVKDVARTAAWYGEVLGFDFDPFPATPPFSFAILTFDGVQIMLRKLRPNEPEHIPSLAWDAYLRVHHQTLLGLWNALKERTDIVEPIRTQFYGDTEFTIRDCDGRQICLSELLPPEIRPAYRCPEE